MENPFRTIIPCFFYTKLNLHVAGPTMKKGMYLASKVSNWQLIKNWAHQLKIVIFRKNII